MKKILLALATVVVSTGAMAQGTFTFGSYQGSTANFLFKAVDGTTSLAGWYATLLPAGATAATDALQGGPPPLGGAPVPISQALDWRPTQGWARISPAADWAIAGMAGGSVQTFAVGISQGPWATGGNKQVFNIPGSVTLGDPSSAPPAPPGSWALTGSTTYQVVVPEPSVIALGVLGGLGVFMLRRRS